APSVSRGAEKWVDLQRWNNADDVIAAMEREGFELVGAEADGDLAPADLAHIPRLALVLGNERDAIAAASAGACKRRVSVPIRGFAERLNVAVVAAVLLASATAGREGDLAEEDRLRMYARGLYLTVDKADEVLAHSA